MSPEAMAYLNEGLNYIQQNSIKRELINWQALRKEVFVCVEEAQTPAETYPAIVMALKHLDDHHSHFRRPRGQQLRQEGKTQQIGLSAFYPEGVIGVVVPSSPAEQAGVQVGDRIDRVNGHPITALTKKQFRMAITQA